MSTKKKPESCRPANHDYTQLIEPLMQATGIEKVYGSPVRLVCRKCGKVIQV